MVARTESGIDGSKDQFPVGMRVLAVDDDATCLRVLEKLLRRCQYKVTTTSDAATALEMLRDNRMMFDLVISDVQMPGMDGFKLLELMGLEMDLPVVMSSVNGNYDVVMKGISHGACDYLLKPVRLEEIKNIWQHVIRRKKFDPNDIIINNQESPPLKTSEEKRMINISQTVNSDGKVNKRRKEEDESEIGELDDDGHDIEDLSAQKKCRVNWSVELHQKFVGAVNRLGIEKAVPKKILDLMNVENLSRENVASHLQKYRQYLRRVEKQQVGLLATYGGSNSPCLKLGSVSGFGNYHTTLAGSSNFHNTLGSFPHTGMLQRLNTSCTPMDNFPNFHPSYQFPHDKNVSDSLFGIHGNQFTSHEYPNPRRIQGTPQIINQASSVSLDFSNFGLSSSLVEDNLNIVKSSLVTNNSLNTTCADSLDELLNLKNTDSVGQQNFCDYEISNEGALESNQNFLTPQLENGGTSCDFGSLEDIIAGGIMKPDQDDNLGLMVADIVSDEAYSLEACGLFS